MPTRFKAMRISLSKKVNIFPYSLKGRGAGAKSPIYQTNSPQMTLVINPALGCCYFLPFRPAVTFPASERKLARVLAVVVCLSVCPSVISRCSTETAKRMITQTTPQGL